MRFLTIKKVFLALDDYASL